MEPSDLSNKVSKCHRLRHRSHLLPHGVIFPAHLSRETNVPPVTSSLPPCPSVWVSDRIGTFSSIGRVRHDRIRLRKFECRTESRRVYLLWGVLVWLDMGYTDYFGNHLDHRACSKVGIGGREGGWEGGERIRMFWRKSPLNTLGLMGLMLQTYYGFYIGYAFDALVYSASSRSDSICDTRSCHSKSTDRNTTGQPSLTCKPYHHVTG